MQGALIAFDRQQVVCFLFADRRGNALLAPHGIQGHQAPLNGQHVQQFRHRRDLIRLGIDLVVPERNARFTGPGIDHVNGTVVTTRATHRFTINGHNACQWRVDQHVLHPTDEQRPKLGRIE